MIKSSSKTKKTYHYLRIEDPQDPYPLPQVIMTWRGKRWKYKQNIMNKYKERVYVIESVELIFRMQTTCLLISCLPINFTVFNIKDD